MKAGIINIGSELTSGLVCNSNASHIGKILCLFSLDVGFILTLPDRVDTIVKALKQVCDGAQLVVITGGLGPTHDDCTKEALAKFTKRKLSFHKETAELVEKKLLERGVRISNERFLGAYQPEGMEILKNPIGTAPGLRFSHRGTEFFVFPGVPVEMEVMAEQYLIPYLEKVSRERRTIKVIRTFQLPESKINELLEPVIEEFPLLDVAFLPRHISNDIVINAPSEEKISLDRFVEEAKRALGEKIYGYDEDTMESTVGKLLRDKNLTLSVAESCTGGLVSNRITNIPGSSEYFMGGIVSYDNSVKINILKVKAETIEKYGAVSEQTAVEMAEGVRKVLGTDIGVSTTGIAGPSGGTKDKPVGTVWVGYSDREKAFAKKFIVNYNRELNKLIFSQLCLDTLRVELLREKGEGK
ncbi:MAG: CinA family nicotinamide mononucleotide deamidase-related protein [Candidatus Marinimicrobia bacterium]|nr:CinA family nicotinamide mononucleotide deamidase-related protein [Candidatus Neomarinimicrobiota bacterium]